MSQGAVGPADLARIEYRFVAPKRFNRWPQAKLHTQWPGSGKPGDKYFDAFYASQFQSLADSEKSQQINRDAAVALLDKIGPAIVLTHSQSGAYGWLIADARPKLVKALISIEPNGPPVYETELKGAPDWFEDTGPRKTYGLGFVPLAYDPPLKPGETLAFVRQEKPDAPDLVRGWLQAEPARKLPNLAKVPDADRGGGGLVSRRLRPLHRGLSPAGRRAGHIPAARGCRPSRQRPHDDAGKEQRRDRRRAGGLGEEDAGETAGGQAQTLID